MLDGVFVRISNCVFMRVLDVAFMHIFAGPIGPVACWTPSA